jgi:hypothetical protein
MKTKPMLTLLAAVLFLGTTLNAQSCDPWITKAYQEMYGRTPSSSECNTRNYSSGSWNSYAELVGYIAGFNRYKGGNFLKGDPWIFQVYVELYNRIPNAWELNAQNYNKGSWSNYGNLKEYIKQYNTAMSQNGIKTIAGKVNNSDAIVFADNNNNVLGVDLVSLDGGNVIAAGGANVVSAGGANVVAAGGANFRISANTAGVSFGSDRTVQSAGTRVVATAGNTKLVIR